MNALDQLGEAFQAAEAESATATEHAGQSRTVLEEAKGEKERIREKLERQKNSLYGQQVRDKGLPPCDQSRNSELLTSR